MLSDTYTRYQITRWEDLSERWWVVITEQVGTERVRRTYKNVPENEINNLIEALRLLKPGVHTGQYNFCVTMNNEGDIFFFYEFDQTEFQFIWSYDTDR